MKRLATSSSWQALRRSAALPLLMTFALAAGGCATVNPGPGGERASANPADPWEGFNRSVMQFNDVVDDNLLRPLATTWRDTVPQLVRTGVGNFFGNLGDGWSAVNHLLQGKMFSGLDMGMRTLTNTFFGLGGVLDPATEMGLERRSEDFGQTLGRWGVGSGPYLMLPVFGPSSVRDGAALPLDLLGSSPLRVNDDGARVLLTGVRVVNTRAEFLSASRLLDEVALDRYSFLRDAFLARRLNQVWDGDPPEPSTPPPPPPPPPLPK